MGEKMLSLLKKLNSYYWEVQNETTAYVQSNQEVTSTFNSWICFPEQRLVLSLAQKMQCLVCTACQLLILTKAT